MNKTEIIEKVKQITDPARQSQLLYECLDALGLKYHKTNCYKCRRDLYAILLEELELIDDASELSSWDNEEYEWIYTFDRPLKWEGKIYSKGTSKRALVPFCEAHPQYCMKQTKINFK